MTEGEALKGLKRELAELSALYEISKAINSSLDLKVMMTQVLGVLHKNMGMERGTLTLLDSRSRELGISVAHGLDENEITRGRYRIGEGITGKVVEAGEPIVVPNVGQEPLFLNKTKSRDIQRGNIAFICVPIKLDGKTIGALSADRLFQEKSISFEEDVRLLAIIASMITQAVRIHLERQEEKEKLENENILLKRELKKKFHPRNIIGESKRMADVYEAIEVVSQTRATVMLRGESGTGKELVAHAIHYNSECADGPFIKVSCAALPENLLESELFGYEKGAFTGAMATKAGRFEMANGGTLFLDEIGDIPASTQVKLLRVIQEREFERLGGTRTIKVNIRLITATNRDLETEVKNAKFREDLYYRLNVFPIFLPALRERPEDISLLVQHFLEDANKENRKSVKSISAQAMACLRSYSWPGNVRELRNAIERAVILCKSDTLTPDLFPILNIKTQPITPTAPSQTEQEPFQCPPADTDKTEILNGQSLTEKVQELEIRLIRDALQKTDGNQRKAAKMLGVTERIFSYKVKTYNLK